MTSSSFWTAQSLQTDLFDFEDGKGKPGHPTRLVIGLVDDSGSTNNSGRGGGGRGSRGATLAVEPDVAVAVTDVAVEELLPPPSPRDLALKIRKDCTPPILIAEVEGIYEVLRELSKKYNLEGTQIYMFAFASTTRLLFKQHIGSDQKSQLRHVALSHMTLHHTPEFGGTCLVKALDDIVKVIGKNIPSDLIIASDGRTSDENPAGGITVRSMLETNFSTSRLIAIGAGSISGAPGGASVVYSRCGYDDDSTRVTSNLILDDVLAKLLITTPGEVNAVAPKLHGFTECDASFFVSLVESMNYAAVYAPAFRDYTALRAAVHHLLNDDEAALYKKKYTIIGESGLIHINPAICEKMQFLADKKDVGIAFYVSFIKTRYVIILGTDGVFFQVAIEEGSSLIEEAIGGYYVKLHKFPLTYTLAGESNYKSGGDEIPKAYHGTTDCYNALLTPEGFLRARPITETF